MLGLTGTKNKFEASLYRADSSPKDALYTVYGAWNDKFIIHDVAGKTDMETYDTNATPAACLVVAPGSEQDSWESRKAWAGVIDALNSGNMQKTSDEKGKIEQGQRAIRKKEEQEGTKWRQTFFSNIEADPIFEKLAAPVGVKLEADRTMGIWKYDHNKAKEARMPYHGDLTPIG